MHERESPATGLVLSKTHMLDAIAHSTDDGSTLDFSNKNLVEVTQAGAEELAELGKGDDLLDECRILRYVGIFLLYFLLKTLLTCLAESRSWATASLHFLGHSPSSHVFAI